MHCQLGDNVVPGNSAGKSSFAAFSCEPRLSGQRRRSEAFEGQPWFEAWLLYINTRFTLAYVIGKLILIKRYRPPSHIS